jgi:hypothetical protein
MSNEMPAKTDGNFLAGEVFVGVELATNVHRQLPSPCTCEPAPKSRCWEQQSLAEEPWQHEGLASLDWNIFGQRTSKCPSEQKQPAYGRLAHTVSGIIAQSTAAPRDLPMNGITRLAFTSLRHLLNQC